MSEETEKHITDVADMMSSTIKGKSDVITGLAKQKGKFKKALENGFTRKDIIDNLKSKGIDVSMRDLAIVLGKSFKRRKKAASKAEA